MSSDGHVVAVREGQSVHIYTLDDVSMAWDLLADPISAMFTSTSEGFYGLTLSSDGSIVAIADLEYDFLRGRVTIFALHPDDGWAKLGAAIDGENPGDVAGYSIALSADGTAIAIGSPGNDNGTGHVSMYTFNIKTKGWDLRGDIIRAETFGDRLGDSVAISRDGSVIAIGTPWNDGNGGVSGYVRVFEFDCQGSNWVQRGSDTDGEVIDGGSGGSIDLSADGSVVVVGAPGNGENEFEDSGHARVFQYWSDDGVWVQRGNDIGGESKQDQSGCSVAMSADGAAIAIGVPYDDGNGENSGHLRVYDFDSNGQLWVQRGKDIYGEATTGLSGRDVSMSVDGSIVGINGVNTNALRIFQWILCSTPPSSIPTRTPDCADREILLRLELITDRFPMQITWQVTDFFQNETVLNGGPYDDMFSAYEEAHCLAKEGCYQFTILDSASDGICCDWFSGNGMYTLFFDSILIREGGDFSIEEHSILLGDTCPSPIPSLRPSSSNSSSLSHKPTLPPTNSSTLSPKPSNVSSTLHSLSLQPSNVPSLSPTKACPVGHFANSTSNKCESCHPGTYQSQAMHSESCLECQPGTYQPNKNGTGCLTCESGTFQQEAKQAMCNMCRAGGYCSIIQAGACDGGFTPCPVGTYNDKEGQDNVAACRLCPEGTYADGKYGLIQCPRCPYRLSSQGGDSQCNFCDAQFYKADTSISNTKLFETPDKYCKSCPDNVNCTTANTAIDTLQIFPNFWRSSIYTSTTYPCTYDGICLGVDDAAIYQTSNIDTIPQCIDGHSGPLCEVCVEEENYLDTRTGRCSKCPSLTKLAIVPTVLIVICVLAVIGYATGTHFPFFRYYANIMINLISRLNLQAKIKIIISFFQIVNALESVYGVRFHESCVAWFNFFRFFNFGLIDFIGIPPGCIGSMRIRLMVNSLWPFVLIFLLCIGVTIHTIWRKRG